METLELGGGAAGVDVAMQGNDAEPRRATLWASWGSGVYPSLLSLHFLFAFAFVTGNVGGVLITARARREPSPAGVLSLMRAHELAIFSLVIPGGIGALLTGVGLVHVIQTKLTSTWIAASLGLFVLSLAIGVGVLLQPQNQAIAEARRLIECESTTRSPALDDAIAATPVVAGEWSQVVIMVALILLMAFKPA